MEDLAAVDVVDAARRERDRVHRAEHALEEHVTVVDEVVGRVQALQLDGRDVERDRAQAALGEVVGRPAGVGADVEDALAGLKRNRASSSWYIERDCTYQ